MALKRDQCFVLAGAAALRLIIFLAFPDVQALLTQRVEISTPVISFKRLQEGLYLYSHNVSPYDGGVYHQVPLYLPIFSLLPDYRNSPIWTNLLYILVDTLSAVALIQIADSGEASSSSLFKSTRKDLRWTSTAIASAYLFNPFTIASTLGQSSSTFTNCAILHAIATALDCNVYNSVLALATASYFSMYPILLAPPLALLTYDRLCVTRSKSAPRPALFFTSYTIGLTIAIAVLFGVSYLIMGNSWQWVASTYGPHLLLSDLTPNVGLWWYFFIEMFDSFRPFFLGVFWLHMISYVAGLSIKFRRQPLFVITTLLGLFAVFKPYPSIADASLYFALLPLYRHIFPLFRYGFIATIALLHATFLAPAFYHLWINVGSGNANFFYAITLVWALGLTLVIADSIWACLRDELEVERPELRGKDVRQI